MTDRALASALTQAVDMERHARAHWEASARAMDTPERDAAAMVMRHATAVKRSIEQWMVARSTRAAMVK